MRPPPKRKKKKIIVNNCDTLGKKENIVRSYFCNYACLFFFLTSFFSFFLQVVDTKSLLPVSCLCVSYGCWISVPVLNINSEHVFLC